MESPIDDSLGKSRIRVDELEKKNVFSVPDRYFDRLPSQIQARVSGRNQAAHFSFGCLLRAGAFASVALLVLSLWFFHEKPGTSPEAQLAGVSPEEIATYLQNSEVTQRELIEVISQTTTKTDENLFQPSDITENELIEGLSNQEAEELLLQ